MATLPLGATVVVGVAVVVGACVVAEATVVAGVVASEPPLQAEATSSTVTATAYVLTGLILSLVPQGDGGRL